MSLILNGDTGISGVDGSSSTPAVQGNDTNTGMFFPAADTIAFAEGGTEVMRIDSSGNVGIGTSSPTTGKLVISQNNLVQPAISLPIDESTIQGPYTNTKISMGGNLFLAGNNIATVASYGASGYINFLSNGANERMRISSTGGLSVGTTSDPGAGAIYATGNITAFFSDARLKDFKGTIPDALAKVQALNGYYFTENEKAKELGYNNDKVQVGVSAQEVEAVLPEIVTEAPISAEYKTVYYDKLVPLLIEAIKELKAEVDELKKGK